MARFSFILTFAIGLSLLATSASALSCLRPDLGQTMERAKQSDKVYYVLVGQFDFRTTPINPKFDPDNQNFQRPPLIERAYFSGVSLSPNRRTDVPLRNFPVDIEVSCSGPWCGGFPSASSRQIAFVEERYGQAPILRISACPGQTFEWQDQKQIRSLRNCFDKKCQSLDPHEVYR